MVSLKKKGLFMRPHSGMLGKWGVSGCAVPLAHALEDIEISPTWPDWLM